jgi:hypothetical protein
VEGEKRGNRGFVEERRGSVRILINEFIGKVMMEKGGIIDYDDTSNTEGDVDQNQISNRTVSAFIHGDLINNSITVSQASAMIRDIPDCRELIESIMGETTPMFDRLKGVFDH